MPCSAGAAALHSLSMDAADRQENITDAEWLVMRALWDADTDAYRFVAHRLSHILRDRDILPPPRVSRQGAVIMLAGLAACVLAAALFHAHLDPAPTIDPAALSSPGTGQIVQHESRNGVFSCYWYAHSSNGQ